MRKNLWELAWATVREEEGCAEAGWEGEQLIGKERCDREREGEGERGNERQEEERRERKKECDRERKNEKGKEGRDKGGEGGG